MVCPFHSARYTYTKKSYLVNKGHIRHHMLNWTMYILNYYLEVSKLVLFSSIWIKYENSLFPYAKYPKALQRIPNYPRSNFYNYN